jgi:protein deglycase
LPLSIVQVLVPFANGTEEMEATFIIYILRRAGANVIVASVENSLEIVGSREVKFIADALLDEVLKLDFDLIVLPVSSPHEQVYVQISTYIIRVAEKTLCTNRSIVFPLKASMT